MPCTLFGTAASVVIFRFFIFFRSFKFSLRVAFHYIQRLCTQLVSRTNQWKSFRFFMLFVSEMSATQGSEKLRKGPWLVSEKKDGLSVGGSFGTEGPIKENKRGKFSRLAKALLLSVAESNQDFYILCPMEMTSAATPPQALDSYGACGKILEAPKSAIHAATRLMYHPRRVYVYLSSLSLHL